MTAGTAGPRGVLGSSLADDLTVLVAADGMVEAFGDVGADAAAAWDTTG
ncbi:MAG: hypothetical protein ACRDZ0_03640 [Acidimicrobiales bacterium]